jgi:S1-C subfamily serine protease
MMNNGVRHCFGSVMVVLAVLGLMLPANASATLPGIIARAKPSIVAVGTFDRLRSPSFKMRGTGFAVGPGNLIATNAHVLPESLSATGGESLVVRIPSQTGEAQQRMAKAVEIDSAHDLALLQIEGSPLPALPLSGERAREGQGTLFIGFPIGEVLGLVPVTHRALVSAVTPIVLPGATAQQLTEKVIRRIKSGTFDIYQLDGTAYPGNSGGPLLDMETGEVIGIINMVFVKGTKESTLSQPSGISFALPVDFLRELLKQ